MIDSLEFYNFKNDLKNEDCKGEIMELNTGLVCSNDGLFTLSQVNSVTSLNTMIIPKVEPDNMLHKPMKFKKDDIIYTIKSIKDENICSTCNGEKKIIYNGIELVCPNCNGTGKILTNKQINIVIDEPFVIESVQVKLDSEFKPTLKYKGRCGYTHLNRVEDNLFFTKEEAQVRCDKLNKIKP
jgi:RecJ-like exonuclease